LQLKNIDVQPNPRQRDLRGGEGFAFKRQRYRQQQIFIGVVAKGPLVDVANFMPGKEKRSPADTSPACASPAACRTAGEYPAAAIKHFFFIFQLINLMR
jgi:hypothetical protein